MNWAVYKKLWKIHGALMFSVHLIVCFLLFSNIIFGNKPLICKYKNEWYILLLKNTPPEGTVFMQDLSTIAKWDFEKLDYQRSIWPLIILDEKKLDISNSWMPPFSKSQDQCNYLLGSYDLGKDVLAGCMYGLKKSLSLALMVLLFSMVPGIVIGALFTFHAQRIKKISIYTLVFMVLSGFLLIYSLGLFMEWKFLPGGILLSFIFFFLILISAAVYCRNKKPFISFDMDHISLRYIEVMKSIPALLILLLLIQVFANPNTLMLAGILSLLFIPTIAKYARSFTIGISQEAYISSGIAIGQTGWNIFVRHILAKLMTDLLPVFAFGIANIILLEASISFLGLGLPVDEVSLGTLMHAARSNPSAWWVIVFPGLLVFWLVSTFNSVGNLWNKMHLVRDFQT